MSLRPPRDLAQVLPLIQTPKRPYEFGGRFARYRAQEGPPGGRLPSQPGGFTEFASRWGSQSGSGRRQLAGHQDALFEVAIIDLDLPPVHGVAMTGWDLVRIFRAFNPAVSIILLGSEGGRDVKARAERLKVSEFLEKPITPSALKAIVKTLDPVTTGCRQ